MSHKIPTATWYISLERDWLMTHFRAFYDQQQTFSNFFSKMKNMIILRRYLIYITVKKLFTFMIVPQAR